MTPRIPVIQDSAQLATQTGRQTPMATPDAFGAQEARALARVGQGLAQVGTALEEVDDEFNRANAIELENQLSARLRQRLYNTEDGYFSTQRGINALDGRAQVEADIDGYAAELAGQARNPRARAMFEQIARQRVGNVLGSIAEYAQRQNTDYQNGVSEARLNEFLDNSVAGYADEGLVAGYLDGAVGEIEAIGRRNGWSEEETRGRIRRFQSDVTARVIVQLAATDPQAAEEMYLNVRPTLSAQEAGELGSTMRQVRRQAEDDRIDQAWTFVSEGREIPPDVWNDLPGRARIDIQDYRRRRAEGGAVGDRALIAELQVMALEDPERFARADLRAARGALGDRAWVELTGVQQRIRAGDEDQTVQQQRATFNALVATAEASLAPYGVDLSVTDGMGRTERTRAVAMRAALNRELQAFQASGGGVPTADEAQVIIGRAIVSMRSEDVPGGPGELRVEGRRGRTSLSRVRPTTEAVVPYGAIDRNIRRRIRTTLDQRLGREATQGEIENAYAAMLRADPRTRDEVNVVYDRIIVVGGDR